MAEDIQKPCYVVENGKRNIPRWMVYLFEVYIVLSFFETYLTKFIGTSTKFYLLGLILLFVGHTGFKVTITRYAKFYLLWFLYKCLSITWSSMENATVSTHFLSQIGMIMFLLSMTGIECDKRFLNYILKACYWCSFLFGVLSVFFRASYISEVFSARQVLTLFGLQNDPNNCAAFLIVGFMLSFYAILFEKKKYFINLVVLMTNLYAIMLTASRAGLVSIAAIVVLLVFVPSSIEKKKVTTYIKRGIITMLAVALGLYLVEKYLPAASFNRMFSFEGYLGGSSRSDRWEDALKVFWKNPIFGCGWGGYNLVGYGSVSGIHNTFLSSLCDVGIVGTGLLIVPMIMMVIDGIKRGNNLVVFILASGMFPAFFIDAINKRFFWNAIIISMMLLKFNDETGESISLWNEFNC